MTSKYPPAGTSSRHCGFNDLAAPRPRRLECVARGRVVPHNEPFPACPRGPLRWFPALPLDAATAAFFRVTSGRRSFRIVGNFQDRTAKKGVVRQPKAAPFPNGQGPPPAARKSPTQDATCFRARGHCSAEPRYDWFLDCGARATVSVSRPGVEGSRTDAANLYRQQDREGRWRNGAGPAGHHS
jgi:hypothetical protein